MMGVTIVGGGFSGLAAAYELARHRIPVTVLEAQGDVGGLAAAFEVGGAKVERFYHHWFTNDLDVMALVDELGLRDQVTINPTNTGMYYANRMFRLSTPVDLINFTPLPFTDRLRLGLLALRVRRVRDWTDLENKTAAQWLRQIGGDNVFRVVWEPLLLGKFGPYAGDVSAVWFWNKIKLRGSSRGRGGEERLAYFKGGFAALATAVAGSIRALGGRIVTNTPVHSIDPIDGGWSCVTADGAVLSRRVISTTALPLIAEMVRAWAPEDYVQQLERIKYLANVCLVLEMKRSLSETYWLNVNDPGFPFVGVIEHTNFEPSDTYGGNHIVYLSKYLPHSDPLYALSEEEFLEYAFPYLKIMFPALERSWIRACHLWRADWAQPVVEKHYSRLIPQSDGPFDGFHICSMAQVYPEDRGTNYSIRDGRRLGARIAQEMHAGNNGRNGAELRAAYARTGEGA